ncbi:MAG: DUF2281 domain-containing protein [Timaviella obliquedivisa GSE-PSE-MK23-08B]|nr:DUF2281 domain-containing protein [Timaviella obliquedivisa GSE-PSE-MK23-08B]
MRSLIEKINTLPPHLRVKVEEFVNALEKEELKPKSGKRLRQDWAGALNDYRDRYTSLELQNETVEQWTK